MVESLSLKKQLEVLIKLQDIDQKIDQMKVQKNHLPVHLKEVHAKVEIFAQQLDTQGQQLNALEQTLKQIKSALTINTERLERSQERLSSVSNSQEYQAILKEIEQLKKLSSSLIEQEFSAEEQLENLQTTLQALKQEHDELLKSLNIEKEDVIGQSAQFDQRLEDLEQQREAFLHQVDKPVLNQYTRVRGARAGVGIVSAENGRCAGCHMMVSPQMFIEIKKGSELHTCPSCRRLLYLP